MEWDVVIIGRPTHWRATEQHPVCIIRPFGILTLVAVVFSATAYGGEQITQADLLRRVIDLERLTTPPAVGERTGMFSSRDRRSRIDADGSRIDWGANEDCGQFVRQEDDGWNVMAEMQGPGAITHIWSADPKGEIRFILDGEAAIAVQFDELLSGSMEPFAEPLVYRGMNCYFPIGYDKSCKVVCRDSTLCYQINFVQFPPGTRVERFKFELDEAAQAAVAEVKTALAEGLTEKQLFGGRRLLPVAAQQDLGPGDTLAETVDGAGTLRALYVGLTDKINPRDLYALHRCILRVFVDGEQSPRVEAPLVDFFGSGFDLVPFDSLVIGTNRKVPIPLPDRRYGEDRYMYCYFPQPFREGLRIEIQNVNRVRKTVGLLLHMRVDRRPPPADALRFHARFHKEDPCRVFEYPVVEAARRGRLVGCVLNVDCPRAAWWGEGDDKAWIDDERLPSYFGTGTDNYVGDAGGLHACIGPLVGVTRTGPYGKSSAYRWHISDAINFQKSIRFTLENLQPAGVKDTYYSSVAFWYGEPGGTQSYKPLTLEDLTPPGLRIPGAVEVEDHIIGAGWGHVVRQNDAEGAELSGEQAAGISTTEPVQMDIPSPSARVVLLKLRTNPRRPFETIVVADGGGQTIGTVRYDTAAEGMYTVGVIRLEKGSNRITVQCARPAMLDCWILEGVPQTQPAGLGP